MKLAFLLLLAANLAVFAWQYGAFGLMPDSGREPERVNRQIEAERIRVLTPADVQKVRAKVRDLPNANAGAPATAAASSAANNAPNSAANNTANNTANSAANGAANSAANGANSAAANNAPVAAAGGDSGAGPALPLPSSAPSSPNVMGAASGAGADQPSDAGANKNGTTPMAMLAGAACVELGDLSNEARTRAQPRLAQLKLGDRISERSVDLPGWFMVYIPPAKSRFDMDARADDLKKRGVKDMLLIADSSPMRFGISLGSFRDPELARRHLAMLEKRGVKDARIADSPTTIAATRYQIRNVDAALAQQLTAIQKDFPQTHLAPCGSG